MKSKSVLLLLKDVGHDNYICLYKNGNQIILMVIIELIITLVKVEVVWVVVVVANVIVLKPREHRW